MVVNVIYLRCLTAAPESFGKPFFGVSRLPLRSVDRKLLRGRVPIWRPLDPTVTAYEGKNPQRVAIFPARGRPALCRLLRKAGAARGRIHFRPRAIGHTYCVHQHARRGGINHTGTHRELTTGESESAVRDTIRRALRCCGPPQAVKRRPVSVVKETGTARGRIHFRASAIGHTYCVQQSRPAAGCRRRQPSRRTSRPAPARAAGWNNHTGTRRERNQESESAVRDTIRRALRCCGSPQAVKRRRAASGAWSVPCLAATSPFRWGIPASRRFAGRTSLHTRARR